jgi:hypothetical protein
MHVRNSLLAKTRSSRVVCAIAWKQSKKPIIQISRWRKLEIPNGTQARVLFVLATEIYKRRMYKNSIVVVFI